MVVFHFGGDASNNAYIKKTFIDMDADQQKLIIRENVRKTAHNL